MSFFFCNFVADFACVRIMRIYMMNSVWIVIGLVAAAILLLCVGIILRKDHSFRSQHIGENERMKEDKIHCATSQDRETRKMQKMDIKNL